MGHFAWQWVQKGSRNSAPDRVGLHSNSGVLTRVSAQSWLEEAPCYIGGYGSECQREDAASQGTCVLLYLGQGGMRVTVTLPVRGGNQTA